MDLQTEVMQRLMAGETMPAIMADINKRVNKMEQPAVEKQKYSDAQMEAGRKRLDEIFVLVAEILRIFNYPIEATQVTTISREQRDKLLTDIDSVVTTIKRTVVAMGNQK